MNSEYPPLPRPGGTLEARSLTKGFASQPEITERLMQSNGDNLTPDGNPSPTTKVISVDGDVIIEYTDQDGASSTGTRHWQVASELLMRNSPYFRALLDPYKFAEGRRFMEQKQAWNGKITLIPAEVIHDRSINPTAQRVLPMVKIPTGLFTRMFGVDAIELFLHILCLDSLTDEQRSAFESDLKSLPPSLVARLIEAADAFNSPDVVRDTLQKIHYSFGKGKISLCKVSSSLLKVSEDRIRQIIFVAMFLGEHAICQVLTHTLLVLGSRFWTNGPEAPATQTLRWRYFPDGIEEELYHRRQCVLNTITDLQAYFLRAYGALEDLDDDRSKPPSTNMNTSLGLSFSSTQPRQFQCRGGFGNSSACDLFHLGQMTRFFAIKAKTVFLGSTLIDPDFSLSGDEEDHRDADKDRPSAPSSSYSSGAPSDITAIISSLKQYPDYQIDTHHLGCGVRRRFLPALDCIEKFIWDGRGLLGTDLRVWDRTSPRASAASWASHHPSRPTHSVDVRFAKITAVHYLPDKILAPRAASQEEDARLLFTARKRNWEA